jgi:hypothetical protein
MQLEERSAEGLVVLNVKDATARFTDLLSITKLLTVVEAFEAEAAAVRSFAPAEA